MSKRDDLIAIYAGDLKDKCGVTPDMELLTKGDHWARTGDL